MFSTLLTHQKNSIQKEAAWMISNVTAGNVNQIQAVIDNGLIPLVIDIIAKVTAFTNFLFVMAEHVYTFGKYSNSRLNFI